MLVPEGSPHQGTELPSISRDVQSGQGVQRYDASGSFFLIRSAARCAWVVRVVDVGAVAGQSGGQSTSSLARTGISVGAGFVGLALLGFGAWAVDRGLWTKPVSPGTGGTEAGGG